MGWFVYDWQLGLMLAILAGFVALFYAAALIGPGDAKIKKVFAWTILAITLIAIGVTNQTDRGSEDAPRLCNRVEC